MTREDLFKLLHDQMIASLSDEDLIDSEKRRQHELIHSWTKISFDLIQTITNDYETIPTPDKIHLISEQLQKAYFIGGEQAIDLYLKHKRDKVIARELADRKLADFISKNPNWLRDLNKGPKP